MKHKWHCKSRKGYLKIHVVVDISSRKKNEKKAKILSLNVTTEKVHDSKVLSILVHDIVRKQNIDANTVVVADGSYDNNKIFQFLSFNNIKPSIKVRKNARIRNDNHYKRNIAIVEQKTDFNKWKNSVSYGKRWMVESVFSSMKRMFGEYMYICC